MVWGEEKEGGGVDRGAERTNLTSLIINEIMMQCLQRRGFLQLPPPLARLREIRDIPGKSLTATSESQMPPQALSSFLVVHTNGGYHVEGWASTLSRVTRSYESACHPPLSLAQVSSHILTHRLNRMSRSKMFMSAKF